MKSAFEKWVESEYGDSLMAPSGAVAAWNAAVFKCLDLAYLHLKPEYLIRQIAALEEDFHSEGD